MILVDTSVWIDFFLQSSPAIDKKLNELMEEGEVMALSIVFGELLQGARNMREEKIILEFWEALPEIDEEEIFIDAGLLSNKHKLMAKGVGLLDCCILASCKRNRLVLWSLDKKLNDAYSLL